MNADLHEELKSIKMESMEAKSIGALEDAKSKIEEIKKKYTDLSPVQSARLSRTLEMIEKRIGRVK